MCHFISNLTRCGALYMCRWCCFCLFPALESMNLTLILVVGNLDFCGGSAINLVLTGVKCVTMTKLTKSVEYVEDPVIRVHHNQSQIHLVYISH